MQLNRNHALVKVQDLHQISARSGSIHKVKPSTRSSAVMDGRFFYHDFESGLSVHAAEVRELQDLQNTIELAPSLSFNLVFDGELEFCLGGKHQHLHAQTTQPPLFCGIVLSRPEVMTRFLCKDRRVRKLNISLPLNWLQQRAKSPAEKAQLATLSLSHLTVEHWQATHQQLELALRLMAIEGRQESFNSLMMEALVMQLASLCLSSLIQRLAITDSASSCDEGFAMPSQPPLKVLVDQQLKKSQSLETIALSLHLSVSTLQRKFKQATGMTVIEYMRICRLEQAKTALAVEGRSIQEAAYLAGYKHSSNFSTAFKKQFLMTPAELVRLHQA